MLLLKSKPLSDAGQRYLDTRQSDVNSSATFGEQADRAGLLWDRKATSQAGKRAFEEVKNTLISMCVGVELCNYCEQSEASDIEHILPKSLFPGQAFAWTNYLLACKKCNTTHKSDSIFVFHPAGSANAIKVQRGTQPPSQDCAFVQPRLEDPMDWMELNLRDFLFYARPPHAPGTQGYEKVEKTLEILELNNRPALVKYRRAAFGNYKRMLREYVAVKQAVNHTELEAAVNGDPEVDTGQAFETEQQRLLDNLKKSVLTGEHPTVWREMIRQQALLPASIQQLIQTVPELHPQP